MKKLLLVSTAIAGVAMLSSPASAALKMELGGYFDGYGVYADNHTAAGTANNVNSFDLRRDTEVHVNGETTLDNGLTIGAHTELRVGNNDQQGTNNSGAILAVGTLVATDEVYGYASGGWGRVNFGQEDGAAYLLQVAAPSADSNIDGLRTYIQALNPILGTQATGGGVAQGGSATVVANGLSTLLGGGLSTNAFGAVTVGSLDYQSADFRQTDRFTYLTPKFNGFQAGASFAPQPGLTSATGSMPANDGGGAIGGGLAGSGVAAQFKNVWDVAARWDGEFQGFGLTAGGGFSDSSLAGPTATAAQLRADSALAGDSSLTKGIKTWNGGLSVAYSGFTLGGDYRRTSTTQMAMTTVAAGAVDADVASGDVVGTTWVGGLGYDNGPYHVGASYMHDRTRLDAISGVDTDLLAQSYLDTRYTIGGGYTYGPGMTFRGSVAWGKFDSSIGGVPTYTDTNSYAQGVNASNRYEQVAIGTDIQF